MVETGIFATTYEVEAKAGANASATALTLSYTNNFLTQAESEINIATRHNWSNVYSTLDVDTRGLLKQAASNLAGIYVISYDMDAIGIQEATNRVNVLRDAYLRNLGILRDKKAQLALKGTFPST